MSTVLSCIVNEHDLRLVAVALIVCLIGSAATVQLFSRILVAHGASRAGWIALTAVGTGTMIWCTHFVAMMAFHSDLPVTLNPGLTLGSLGIAIGLTAPGLMLAASRRRDRALAGGAVVGVAISAMHYTGMAAYRIDGVVKWHWSFVILSILLSSLLAAVAFNTFRSDRRHRRVAGALTLGLAVATLHFTGMAAMEISAMSLHPDQGLSASAMAALGFATACAGLLFIGCAAVSALIDGQTQSDSFKRLRRMALYDGLTDLPNRMSFNEELEYRRERRDGAPHMAVVMLDLSRFKSVNDNYGHEAGDQLLVALAARMRAALLPDEMMARLGGDEFATLVSFSRRDQLDDFLARLAAVFDEPFAFERFSTMIGANVGIAIAPQDGSDADTLLARADLAMYRAKNAHSTIPCFYDASMDDAARARRELATELRAAVADGAFELHYQVQASAETGDICGYEALVRWRHPKHGLIAPLTFIPLAEEIGEIIALSRWIITQACYEAALWPNRHVVAVNLSPLHLSDPDLVDTVRRALDESGLPANRLALELTESAIISDRRYALEQLRALAAMGVSLALDDFGVGYSSLDVLRSFSFDKIKLDKSFVETIDTDEHALAILRSVIALGSTLRIPVLAEGIEQPAQLRIVTREGCAAVQGYLTGRPSRQLADPAFVRAIVMQAASLDPDLSLVA